MHSSVHGNVGVSIGKTVLAITGVSIFGVILGSFLAFLSHDPVDRLGEKGYPSMKITLLYEVIPFLITMLLGFYDGNFWLYLLWYTSGNVMDLIDKKLYLSVFFPKKFPATYHFKCHRRRPNIQLNLKQTKIAMYISVLTIIIINFIKL